MRALVSVSCLSLLGAFLLAGGGARAQEPTGSAGTALAPSVQPLQLAPLFGEPTGSAGALPPAVAILPLRLSLMGDAFPIANAWPGHPCETREEASGNTMSGFAPVRQTYLPIAPQLTLHGFTRGGCPIDAGAGGGLTWTLPLRKQMWLVAGAGVFSQPALPGRNALHTDAKLDLVLRGRSDHPLAVGVGRRGITLSGLW